MIQKNRSFDVILFDLGDTLIYFDGKWEKMLIQSNLALFHSLIEQGIQVEKIAFLTAFSKQMQWYYKQREITYIEYTSIEMLKITLEKLGVGKISDSTIETALVEMYRVSQNHWFLEKDAYEILTWLTSQGYRLGLITNASDTIDVNTLLSKYQLNQYFEKIIISAAYGLRKPHPAIFNEAIQYFEYPQESYLMVGDKLANDVLGAQNAGIHSAWIKRRGRTEFNQQHRHIQPDYQLETLLDLKEIV
ncbi:MAG: hypothetical protein CL609_09870 [Anaerolineaceae bacterium]|nr:hypothetical protein [Anaerolineaceae bacterium]